MRPLLVAALWLCVQVPVFALDVQAPEDEAAKRRYHSNKWHLDRALSEYNVLSDTSVESDVPMRIKRLLFLKSKIEVLSDENEKLLGRLNPPAAAFPPDSPANKTPAVLKRVEDWRQWDAETKEMYVYDAFGRMEENGILMMQTPFSYVESLDRMTQLSEFRGAPLENVLLLRIYEAEPQARPKLRQLLAGYFPASGAR